MISIELNKKLDLEVYKDFQDFSTAGVDFAELIKEDHPSISSENAERYINNFYSENKEILEQSCTELTSDLNAKQKDFFGALKVLFEMNFSAKQYSGYISIFNCNPRFVDSKEFQIFYKRNLTDKLAVTFHEVVHFAFFEYCEAHFSEKIKGVNKNSGKLWELSEIFNVIILNSPIFSKILEREEKLFYPQLNEKLAWSKTVWDKVNGNIYEFLKISLQF